MNELDGSTELATEANTRARSAPGKPVVISLVVNYPNGRTFLLRWGEAGAASDDELRASVNKAFNAALAERRDDRGA